MPLKQVKLTAVDKIRNGKEARLLLGVAVDLVTIGRSAILYHDFLVKLIENSAYKNRWPNFVA